MAFKPGGVPRIGNKKKGGLFGGSDSEELSSSDNEPNFLSKPKKSVKAPIPPPPAPVKIPEPPVK